MRTMMLVALTLMACGPQDAVVGQQPGDGKETDSVKDDLVFGSRVRQLPMRAATPSNTAALTTNMLKYYGGKVIANAQVLNVNWGGAVNAQVRSKLPAFYQGVLNSPYVDWLTEYDTAGRSGLDGQPGSNQTIGRGALAGDFTITPTLTATSISDTQIQAELSRQINAGALPAPTDNTYYAINFPKGVRISQGGTFSCQAFCAYHGTFTKSGQNVYYGVLPSLEAGTGCESGCGSASMVDNATAVASHELVEAITDAEVGLGGASVGRPLAWYNTQQGEIGDLCTSQGTVLGGDGVTYTVQTEYDNVTGKCIVSKSTGGGTGGGTASNDFSLAVNATAAAVSAGGSTSVTVSTAVLSGAAAPVTLSVTGLPAGVTGSFAPASVPAGGSATLTLSASASAAVGTATATITGAEGSVQHTTTFSLAVTSATGGEVVLTNSVAVSVAGAKGSQTFYRLDVPAGASNLVIQVSGGTGDVDLYTRAGARPSTTTFDCRPYLNGNAESCSVPAPAPGSYYVLLDGFAAYSGASLIATFSTGGGSGGGTGGGDPVLSSGVPVTGLSGAKGSSTYLQVVVPPGTSQLTLTTVGSSSNTNDADLYLKVGSHPTASNYNCRSWNYGSNEQCVISAPQAGTWYVLVRGYTAFSGLTVQADLQ